ncbi:MAG: hypothetical protein JSR77_11675 [Planctomycetes bacterium]|nr:hypothetical protein [Planctomycetota bacterium]
MMIQGRAIRQIFGREAIKTALGALLRWEPMTSPQDGLSIILGVPWDLRHLLAVNLRFVAKTDLSRVRDIHVVFDRRHRPEMEKIREQAVRAFPDLPLRFHWYPAVSGWVVEKVHVSTFYNSMNTVLALGRCTTKYAVLHDFDLYPLRADHFTLIADTMQRNGWRFSGHELTHFDGLEDKDNQIGTWTLGIDVEWLRAHHRPIRCFHRVTTHRGRQFNLDPFAWLQFSTPLRGLTEGLDPSNFCHVKNLCSTYLRFLKRAPLKVAWRLHYLWYLESLSGMSDRLTQVIGAMDHAESPVLSVDRLPADFTGVHVTCANVLRGELMSMERAIFGAPRAEAIRYVDAFERFLSRFGSSQTIFNEDGSVAWAPPPNAGGVACAAAADGADIGAAR